MIPSPHNEPTPQPKPDPSPEDLHLDPYDEPIPLPEGMNALEAFRIRMEHWINKEELGGSLDALQAALNAIEPGDLMRELELYREFATAATGVDWCCVVAAQDLVLNKLFSLFTKGIPATSDEAIGYFEILSDLLVFDDSPEDCVERFEYRISDFTTQDPTGNEYAQKLYCLLEDYLRHNPIKRTEDLD